MQITTDCIYVYSVSAFSIVCLDKIAIFYLPPITKTFVMQASEPIPVKQLKAKKTLFREYGVYIVF